MGGTTDPSTNSPGNLVYLCSSCHEHIESHRETARVDGWLVRQGHDPSTIPVLYRGSWRLLEADGSLGAIQDGRDVA